MRIQTEEWRRFIPGVRMYKGKKTLFYNGEILLDHDDGEAPELRIYDEEERESWEVIIVLPGVEVIPYATFICCKKLETVIMSDTVIRIEYWAFYKTKSLSYVRLSRNLEYIGVRAFRACTSLSSIFIPPSCTEIAKKVFLHCEKLIIFIVPQHTILGNSVVQNTALIRASPIKTNRYGFYKKRNRDRVNVWIKNHQEENEFSLHRACSSYNPLNEIIFNIIKRQGLRAFKKEDSIGVTASQYLSENPYTEIEEQQIIKRYILDMMGEVI